MFRQRFLFAWMAAAALGFIGGSAALAQEPKGEVAVFGGGAHVTDGGGNHATFGGSVAGKVAARTMMVGEFAYVPMGSGGVTADIPAGATVSGSYSSRLYVFGGGVRVNLAGDSRVVPYLAFGAGAGRGSNSGSVSYRYGNISGSVSAAGGETKFGVNGGFGVKLYAGKSWGIKPEVKFYKFFGEGAANVVAFGGGLFFDFGK